MKRKLTILAMTLTLVVLAGISAVLAQGPQPRGATVAPGTGFTYQGQLKKNNVPVNDNTCSMTFSLWDAANGGAPVGGNQTLNPAVANGLFTVVLNGGNQFGASAFDGSGRWLQTAVLCTGDGSPITLSRQQLTAAPYALFASNANLLGGQDSSAFVNISAAQTISGLKTFSGGVKFPDGTTQTTAFYRRVLPGPGAAATVDSLGIVGSYTSITIGADGLGLVSYHDATNPTYLKVLHCGNAACSGGNIATTVDGGNVGRYTSITIGKDGLGLISYYDYGNGDLKVLHCPDASCSSGGGGTTVDSTGDVGLFTSITIGADGLGLISYRDGTNHTLKVLHCGSVDCSIFNTATTVDNLGDVGVNTSVTIGADGLGLISYYDVSNGDLKVLHCSTASCSFGGNISTTVDSVGDVGLYTSITIGADLLGLISYYDQTNHTLKVLHCGNAACSSGNTPTTVDSVGNVGLYTSITIGADGLGLVSYYDSNQGDLKVLHCGNAACSSANTPTTVDSVGDVGWYTSITIGADGLGLISYYDFINGDLKVFHCSNLTCTYYTRVGR